jgi:hypothetical protein
MTLQVVLRSEAGDAFLLEAEDGNHSYLYDRYAQTVTVVPEPATLIGRGKWHDFDGDASKILAEVAHLQSNFGSS